MLDALAHAGRHAISYTDEGNPDRPLTLHAYRAETYAPNRPVVLVQHGMLRNGDEYRDFWIPAADRHGLLIVAPTFSNEAYAGPEGYNNGLVLDEAGSVRPRDAWAYASLGRLWARLRAEGVTARERAHVFGHSAGGQFLHRLLSTQDHAFIESAVAGNPGWYTLPTFDKAFPEGMGGIGLDEGHLRRLLAFPLVILAGEGDVATDDPNLPGGEAALRQGPHRFARASFYVEAGREAAERLGAPFAWRLERVPLIGHDGCAMSAVAASLWFEGGQPARAELERLAGRRAA